MVSVLLPRLLHGNGCRFFWRTNADCAVGPIRWECFGQRSLLWYRGILCSIRKRSPSRWTGASMSRRISCGRCDMIADSDSDIPGPGFSSERTVVRRRPLKSLDLAPASPVYYPTQLGLQLSPGHHQPIAVRFVLGEHPMSVEILTYAALGARLNISPQAARSLSRRLKLPRSLSDDGKALVSVDLAEIRHTPLPPRGRASRSALLAAKIEALKAEIARLETTAADHRADFERERERADRLAVELLQATAETTAAQEVTARLEDEVAALRSGGLSGDSVNGQGQAGRRLGHLAASIVQADRKACR